MQPARRRIALAGLGALTGLGSGPARADKQRDLELRYLVAAVSEPLLPYAHIEIPAIENIRIGQDAAGPHLGLRTYYGQRKNNGVRAEISVDVPWNEGDTISYTWRFMIPKDFPSDAPQNRWWLFGQWHDQPDTRLGETWNTLPIRSPPVALGYGQQGGKDQLAFVYGAPKPVTLGLIPFEREQWNRLVVTIKWSRGADGRAAILLNDPTPRFTASGANMNNAYRHFLKVGSYRNPEIRGDAWVFLGDLAMRKS